MESRQRKLTEKFHSKRDLYDYMLLKCKYFMILELNDHCFS